MTWRGRKMMRVLIVDDDSALNLEKMQPWNHRTP